MKRGQIEKGRKVKPKSKYQFDEMEPGDSFFYEGNRNTVIMAFGYYKTSGLYKTVKERVLDKKGNVVKEGWRFHLLKKE